MERKWTFHHHDEAGIRRLGGQLKISPLLAQVLIARGFSETAAARRFLDAKLGDLHDPSELPGINAAADLIIKGVIETTSGVNQVLRIGEVDLQADFTLTSTNGKTLSMASASGGAYTGSNSQNAARGVWEEKSEEIVGKLLKDYCSGK